MVTIDWITAISSDFMAIIKQIITSNFILVNVGVVAILI